LGAFIKVIIRNPSKATLPPTTTKLDLQCELIQEYALSYDLRLLKKQSEKQEKSKNLNEQV
jgi:hypothetical protein